MACAPHHLRVPPGQDDEVSVPLVQHYPMVCEGLLHIALFTFTGLNQRHRSCPFADWQARPNNVIGGDWPARATLLLYIGDAAYFTMAIVKLCVRGSFRRHDCDFQMFAFVSRSSGTREI
jgi:hypothetical protein